MPPYMFAELERRITAKREAGVDVISLGIGDPDEPTYPHIVKSMQKAVAANENQKYPSNRGRGEFREAFADFYESRFDVEIEYPGGQPVLWYGQRKHPSRPRGRLEYCNIIAFNINFVRTYWI